MLGLTKWYSSAHTARDVKASIVAKQSAVSLSSNSSFFTISFISKNILYSISTIFSSAFNIKASFSFSSGLIYLSAFVRVCLRSQ